MNYPVESHWDTGGSVTHCPVCGHRFKPADFLEQCAACESVVHDVCSAASKKYGALLCHGCWREYRE